MTGFVGLSSEFLKQYVIIRAARAGVFAGTLEQLDGSDAILTGARRIWYWEGAASLSQMAEEGVSKPDTCKFPMNVRKILVKEVIEVIPISEKAKKSIDSVKIWRE